MSDEEVLAALLRRALKNHDAIAGALRTGMGGPRLFRAIDDMRAVKYEAAELGYYKGLTAALKGTTDDE